MKALFFVRSGDVNEAEYLISTGQNGAYWSNRAYSDAGILYAQDFFFDVLSTYSSYQYNNERWYGRPLRCLVR